MSRPVVLADRFILDAVRQFRNETGPNGEPSVEDFFAHDLDAISFIFAEMWDMLDQHKEDPNSRYRFVQGRLAFTYFVVGQERQGGTIELVQLDVDHTWPTTS